MRKEKETPMLTINEVAERLNASPASVRVWAWRGRFEGATHEQPRAGQAYWLIPESALEGFALQKPGPKPGSKNKKRKGK